MLALARLEKAQEAMQLLSLTCFIAEVENRAVLLPSTQYHSTDVYLYPAAIPSRLHFPIFQN
jgi:hypothetical protein